MLKFFAKHFEIYTNLQPRRTLSPEQGKGKLPYEVNMKPMLHSFTALLWGTPANSTSEKAKVERRD